jgi:hypothetical protein
MALGKDDDSLEKQLLEALRFGGLDKTNLADLVRIVVDFNAKGIRPGKVFPNGVPAADGLRVQATLNAAGLAALLNELQVNPRITGVVIFPYGIINPEVFQTQIDIG